MKQSVLLSLLLALLLVAACGEGVTTGAIENFRPDSTVFTYCGETCAAKGQCGTTTRDGVELSVVLVNPERPATENHGAFIASGQAVTVIEQGFVDMVYERSQEPITNYSFYRIRNEAPAVTGWVDGACVADREQ